MVIMEFLAGLMTGVVIGLVVGMVAADLIVDTRRREHAPTPRERLDAKAAPPAPMPPAWPRPYPYQPPVIVLAAPRARVEQQHSTAVTRY